MRVPQRRKWTDEELVSAVIASTSMRAVLNRLGLKPAGGNYSFISKQIARLELNTNHFKGKAWNKGLVIGPQYRTSLTSLLVEQSAFQSYKLKRRLFQEGLKKEECEMCGWHAQAIDGRIPVELDHINGDRMDNRLENLRILCPNCHSLQPTHRGKNINR